MTDDKKELLDRADRLVPVVTKLQEEPTTPAEYEIWSKWVASAAVTLAMDLRERVELWGHPLVSPDEKASGVEHSPFELRQAWKKVNLAQFNASRRTDRTLSEECED